MQESIIYDKKFTDGKAMIRPEFRKILTDQRGAAIILWSGFMISIAIYLAIAQYILTIPDYAKGLSFAATARVVLWILVMVDFAYLLWWKRCYLAREAILDETKQSKVFRALQEYKGPMEQRAAAVVSTYVTRRIVLFAIVEAIAVYGLVLALVGPYVLDHYLLSAVSLILLALEFPSGTNLESFIQQVELEASGSKG